MWMATMPNEGNGTFGEGVFYGLNEDPDEIRAADLDDDGDADLAVVGGEAVWVFSNHGDGTFAPPIKYGAGALSNSMAIGDLDADGDLDMTVSSIGDDGVSVLLNTCGIAVCTADLDGDQNVATSDLLILLGSWGEDPGAPPDFNGDGVVSTRDLLFLLGEWGPCV
jgi:hypothetical protein